MEEGYIIEFSIGYSESYSHVEAIFEEGPIKIFLAYIPFSVKMFIEKVLVTMNPKIVETSTPC